MYTCFVKTLNMFAYYLCYNLHLRNIHTYIYTVIHIQKKVYILEDDSIGQTYIYTYYEINSSYEYVFYSRYHICVFNMCENVWQCTNPSNIIYKVICQIVIVYIAFISRKGLLIQKSNFSILSFYNL